MINKYNKGFTLAELLLVLAIIGVVTAIGVTVMKPAEKSATKYLYYNAYNTVAKAYYNAYKSGENPFEGIEHQNNVNNDFIGQFDTNDVQVTVPVDLVQNLKVIDENGNPHDPERPFTQADIPTLDPKNVVLVIDDKNFSIDKVKWTYSSSDDEEENQEPLQPGDFAPPQQVILPNNAENLDLAGIRSFKVKEGLVKYINTMSVADKYPNANPNLPYLQFSRLLASPTADDTTFSNDRVMFVSTNGMKFYISDLLGNNELHFILVFVDINGEKGPNTARYTYKANRPQTKQNRILPDIYAFALIEKGLVCPIGIPEYNTSILTTRIAYYDDNGKLLVSKKSYPYNFAKAGSWGRPSADKWNINEPFTLNDKIRSLLPEDSNLVQNINPDNVGIPNVFENSFKCAQDDYESCSVIIDKYHKF